MSPFLPGLLFFALILLVKMFGRHERVLPIPGIGIQVTRTVSIGWFQLWKEQLFLPLDQLKGIFVIETITGTGIKNRLVLAMNDQLHVIGQVSVSSCFIGRISQSMN
jgi:hypothetical protein